MKYMSKKVRISVIVFCVIFTLSSVLCFAEQVYGESNGEGCQHNFSDWVVTDKPTCIQSGTRQKTCSLCGATVQETIPATGQHVWSEWEEVEEPTCTKGGEEERYCKICEETETRTLPKVGHNWGKVHVEKPATSYVMGKGYKTCDLCDGEMSVTIPKRKITTNEKKSRNVVINYLAAAKQYNIKKMNLCFAKKSKDYGYPTRKVNKLFKKQDKRIKWKVLDVYQKGGKYIVKAKVTQPTIYDQAYSAYSENIWYFFNRMWYKGKKDSGIKIANRFFKLLNKKVKKSKIKTETRTISFNVIKTSKGMKIQKKNRTMVDIATCRYNEAVDDANDDYLEDLENGNY